jgi:hypothetical protein
LITSIRLAAVAVCTALTLAVAPTTATAACITQVNGVIDGVNNRSDCLKGTDALAETFKPDRGRLTCLNGCPITDELRRYTKADGDAIDVPGAKPRDWFIIVCGFDSALKCLYWDTTDDGQIDGWTTLRGHSSTARSSVVMR